MKVVQSNGHLKRRRDRPARQEALMRAAMKLFSTRGYEASTTREIAAVAGCAEGLIHRYFKGKAGLLLALMSYYAAQELTDFHDELHPRDSLEDEILQVMAWEVERMWRDRDVLRVSIPRAILDPKLGDLLNHIGPKRHSAAIARRLQRHKECKSLKNFELTALSNAISALAFSFGFLRPAVLRYNRKDARKLAIDAAKIFARGVRASCPAARIQNNGSSFRVRESRKSGNNVAECP